MWFAYLACLVRNSLRMAGLHPRWSVAIYEVDDMVVSKYVGKRRFWRFKSARDLFWELNQDEKMLGILAYHEFCDRSIEGRILDIDDNVATTVGNGLWGDVFRDEDTEFGIALDVPSYCYCIGLGRLTGV